MIKKFKQFLIEDSPPFTPLTPYPGWPGPYVPPYRPEPPLEPMSFPRYREKPSWPPWSNPYYYPPEAPLPPPLLVNPRFIVPRPTQKPPAPPPLISEPSMFDRWDGTPISRLPNYNPFGPFDDVDDGSSQENTQNPNY